MTFEEVLDQAIALLQRRGRLIYRTLQRQFQLDDTALEDLRSNSSRANGWRSMRVAKCWSGVVALCRLPCLPASQRRLSYRLLSRTPYPTWPRRSSLPEAP
jgi:hypothetical protein